MDKDYDYNAEDFSKQRCLDLAMLPSRENADARADQDTVIIHVMI